MVGRRGYGRQAEAQVELTERFVAELTRDGQWESVTPVDTAIAAVRWAGPRRAAGSGSGPAVDGMQDEIVSRVLAKRRWWISPTTTVGKRAIRVMVISYLTRWEHLEELIQELRSAARTLHSGGDA
jgi:glutamate/tyrosine decarboxylase-like PLP-dependent enzyme